MSSQSRGAVFLMAAVFAILWPTPLLVAGQGSSDIPRTAAGRPDLQGVWDFRTVTLFERPSDVDGRVSGDGRRRGGVSTAAAEES